MPHRSAAVLGFLLIPALSAAQTPLDGFDPLPGSPEAPARDAGDPEDAPVAGVQQVLYSRDGSYLRMKVLTNGTTTIESPDGMIRTFDANGLPARIEDRFGNYLNVSTSGQPWVLTDNHSRIHKIYFRTDLNPYALTVDRPTTRPVRWRCRPRFRTSSPTPTRAGCGPCRNIPTWAS